MSQNRALATKIFDHLVSKGAELGNASVLLIESVLDKELKPEGLRTYEFGFEGGVAIVQAADIKDARKIILEKLDENDVYDVPVPDNKIMDITTVGSGVVAYFDL